MAKKRGPKAKISDRRKYLRKKERLGTANDDDRAELAAMLAAQAAPEADDAPDEDTDPDPADDPIEADPGAADPVAAQAAPVLPPPPPPRPRAAPLPAPPRVKSQADDPKGGKEDDWRAKYRTGTKASGREYAVTRVADSAIAILQAMADQCRAAGIQPIIEPAQLRPSAILTFDALLPDRVVITPEMEFFAGSTLILGQRFFKRAEIAAHLEKTAERTKHVEFRKAQAERAAQAEPAVAVDPDPAPSQPEPAIEVATHDREATGEPLGDPARGNVPNGRKVPGPYSGRIDPADPTLVI